MVTRNREKHRKDFEGKFRRVDLVKDNSGIQLQVMLFLVIIYVRVLKSFIRNVNYLDPLVTVII